jgi:hypothetical protein
MPRPDTPRPAFGERGTHEAYETEVLGQQVIVQLVRDRLDDLLPEPLDDVQEREADGQAAVRDYLMAPDISWHLTSWHLTTPDVPLDDADSARYRRALKVLEQQARWAPWPSEATSQGATPDLRGIVVDLPYLEEEAQRTFATAGLADRGRFISGSFFDALREAVTGTC